MGALVISWVLAGCASSQVVLTLPAECSVPRIEIIPYHEKTLHVVSWFCPSPMLIPQEGHP